MIMKRFTAWIAALLLSGATLFGQDFKPVYQNDLEKAEVSKCPDEFFVLDGAFAVQEDGGNKFLELPGAPLDSFGFLFGPAEKGDLAASARILATAKGRRFPTFALGLNGIAGYRVQVNPAKKALELYRGETLKTSAAYQWESGTWTHLRLQIRKTGANYKIEAKAWPEGKPEPKEWIVSAEDAEELSAGKAGVYASPFAGTPLRFDDLVLAKAL